MHLTDDNGRRSAAESQPAASRILAAGETCWRVERARQAAFIIDAKAYFHAARDAIRLARHSILIIGWDFDPRIRLDPDGADPGEDEIGDLLESLVAERPSLHVGVLRWNMPFFIAAGQHPKMPQRIRNWRSGERLQFRFDSAHPFGGAHHQKLLVIDDNLAFCGGIDMAGDRWDEPGHADEIVRRTPSGFAYVPHHDVMMAVNGPAAAALGEMARERWRRATEESFAGAAGSADLWPAQLPADLTDIDIGIARTLPEWYVQPAVRENESLFLRSIEAARRYIYFESQYLTVSSIADALARRLAEPEGPEVVIMLPQHSPGWFDRLAMDSSRETVIRQLRAADSHGRLRIYAPFSAGGRPIVVHSKVTIIDDRFVRVGTANLNHRGMGFDTECDLALEAVPQSGQAAPVRRAAQRLLDALLAEHLGTEPDAVRQALTRTGSLVAGLDRLGAGEHRLRPLDEGDGPSLPLRGPNVIDPEGPEDVWWLAWRDTIRQSPVPTALAIAGVAALGWLAVRRLRRRRNRSRG